MQTWFDVVPDGKLWVVRSQAAEFGRFLTQMQALSVAVAEARKVKDAGRPAQVRVVRGSETDQPFLNML